METNAVHILPASESALLARAGPFEPDPPAGCITEKRERELTDDAAYDRMKLFMRCLTAGFSQLHDLMNGTLSTPELRKNSELGSPVFVRVLASVFNRLTSSPHNWTFDRVGQYFEALAEHTATPFKADSIFVLGERSGFLVGMSSPEQRNQQLRKEVDLLVAWALGTPRGGVVYVVSEDSTSSKMVVQEEVTRAGVAA